MGEYWPIVLLLALSAVIATVMVAGSWLLGPKKNTPYKDSPYECGVAPLGNARERFPIKFYLVAMLFILFDIEVVFLWSWMATYKEWLDAGDPAALYSFWAIMVYMFLWFLGDAYVIRSGALQWEESETLDYESREEADLKVAV
ncbi:MAG: NADH-quinone oxidoreductase subunit A [Armatimonadota bacterium]|nr:NADH-quinone oxidoreductase subunit A [Armatimonadota bacterium]